MLPDKSRVRRAVDAVRMDTKIDRKVSEAIQALSEAVVEIIEHFEELERKTPRSEGRSSR